MAKVLVAIGVMVAREQGVTSSLRTVARGVAIVAKWSSMRKLFDSIHRTCPHEGGLRLASDTTVR